MRIRNSIHSKPQTPCDSRIENRASIYFDYNKPIHTNTVLNVYGLTVGVDEAPARQPLDIYPNPATNHVNLRLGDVADIRRIRIVDLLGQSHILWDKKSIQDLTLNVSGLGAGLYVVQVQTSQGVHTQRLQIQP